MAIRNSSQAAIAHQVGRWAAGATIHAAVFLAACGGGKPDAAGKPSIYASRYR